MRRLGGTYSLLRCNLVGKSDLMAVLACTLCLIPKPSSFTRKHARCFRSNGTRQKRIYYTSRQRRN